jgi:hypothetical protein
LPACGLRGDFLTLNGDFLTLNGDFLTLAACKYVENKQQFSIETRRNKKKEFSGFSDMPKTGPAPPALMGFRAGILLRVDQRELSGVVLNTARGAG